MANTTKSPNPTNTTTSSSSSLEYSTTTGFVTNRKELGPAIAVLNDVRDKVMQKQNVFRRPSLLSALSNDADGRSGKLERHNAKRMNRKERQEIVESLTKKETSLLKAQYTNNDAEEEDRQAGLSTLVPVKDIWTVANPDDYPTQRTEEFGSRDNVPDYATHVFWGKVEHMEEMRQTLTWSAETATKRSDRMWARLLDERNKRLHGLVRTHELVEALQVD
eukprot:PhF_6_TR10365/c3_g2_i2/m.16087